jgi:nucleotide-binding universal stress UspA family protein
MKRLLVPLDGSPLAESILAVAEEWAKEKEEEAELSLLRAVLVHHLPGGDDTEAQVRAVGEAEAYLAGVADRLQRRGLKQIRWAVWYDEPAAAITQAVARNGVDLITMATHGRGGLSRLVLGSVAEAVVRSVRVPVLLIRGQSAWKPWATRRILVPLDGSEPSEGILQVAQRLAGARDLTVVLFTVIDPLGLRGMGETSTRLPELMAHQRGDADRYLAKVAEPLRDAGLRVECVVGLGRAAEAIAAVAGREQVDLIAMATHGRSGLSRLLMGSVAADVLRRAPVPVLLFKAGERAG